MLSRLRPDQSVCEITHIVQDGTDRLADTYTVDSSRSLMDAARSNTNVSFLNPCILCSITAPHSPISTVISLQLLKSTEHLAGVLDYVLNPAN